MQKPNVSHRFGSIFVPQTRPWRLQDGPQRAQDGPKMAPRGSKIAPKGAKMAPREPKMARTTPKTPPDQRSHPIFAPLGPPKRPQEAPQVGHVGPQKSDDVIEDPALFAPLKLCQSQGRRWEGSRPDKKASCTVWPRYFGSQIVPVEGDKGGGKPLPGKGEGGSYSFSNTPRAADPAN